MSRTNVPNAPARLRSVRRAFTGMTTMVEIMAKMSRGTITANDPVSKAVTDKFRTVDSRKTVHSLCTLVRRRFNSTTVSRS